MNYMLCLTKEKMEKSKERSRLIPLTCILRTISILVSQEGTKPQPTLHHHGDPLFLPLVLTVNVPWGYEAKKGLTGQHRILLHSNQVVDNGWHSDN